MKDMNRFNQLQKIYSVFNSFTAEKEDENSEMFNLFDNLDFIFEQDSAKREKIEVMYFELEKYIAEAKELIVTESKTYL